MGSKALDVQPQGTSFDVHSAVRVITTVTLAGGPPTHTPWPSSKPNVRACRRTMTGCPSEPAKLERGFFMGKGFRGNGAARALVFMWFLQNPLLRPLHFHMQVMVTYRSAVDDCMSLA